MVVLAGNGCLIMAAEKPNNSPEASKESLEFFETKIRPLLVERCYECHSAESKKLKGGLRLDSREGGRDAKRVLIVDDNRDAADSLAMLLRLGHHEVLAVSSGQEALDAVRSFRPDLVLLDIGLPDLDGYEVARRLRAAGYQSTLTALTGFGQAEDRERTRRAGFDHHLVKPVDPRTLQAMLT